MLCDIDVSSNSADYHRPCVCLTSDTFRLIIPFLFLKLELYLARVLDGGFVVAQFVQEFHQIVVFIEISEAGSQCCHHNTDNIEVMTQIMS